MKGLMQGFLSWFKRLPLLITKFKKAEDYQGGVIGFNGKVRFRKFTNGYIAGGDFKWCIFEDVNLHIYENGVLKFCKLDASPISFATAFGSRKLENLVWRVDEYNRDWFTV